MSEPKGTIETIALELTSLIQPLKGYLAPGNASITLAELGFVMSPAQETSIAASLTAIVDDTTKLINDSKDLVTAIEADNTSDILSKSIGVITSIAHVINDFAGLKTSLGGLGLAGVTPDMINSFPEKLFNFLFVRYLDRMTGVVPALPPFTTSTFHFDKIGGWLSHPADQLKDLYKWGDNSFDGKLLFKKLSDIFSKLNLPVIYDDTDPHPKLDMVFLEITPKTDIDPQGISIGLMNKLSTGAQTLTGSD